MWLGSTDLLNAQTVRINEFLADNSNSLYLDEDGDPSDWIELFNPDTVAVNLAGWHLTDDQGNMTRWQFPAVSIPAGGYLIVFASGKDRIPTTGNLHTNFGLSAGGEYVALVQADGVTIQSEFEVGGTDYPAQYPYPFCRYELGIIL